jgi:hypothetical protein
MAVASEYPLEPIRYSADCRLHRPRQRRNQPPPLLIAAGSEQPRPQCLRRLEHESTILVLADPGGETLNRVLERDREQAPDLARLLTPAINQRTELARAPQRGLIHKNGKAGNVLANDSDDAWLTGFGVASKPRQKYQVPLSPEIIAG